MSATAVQSLDTQLIPVGLIRAGRNDRKRFDRAGLEQLASSIDAAGLAQPPTVRPMPDGTYQLVAGERRTRAVTEILGWSEIPCHVRQLSDGEAADIMLAENEARADLDPVEQAYAYRARLDSGMTVAELSARCGIPRARIESRLRLLALATDIQHLVATGNLGLGQADQIWQLDHNRQHLALAGLQAGLDSKAFRVLVARLTGEQNAEPMFDPSTFWSIEDCDVREYVDSANRTATAEQLSMFAAQASEAIRARDAGIRAMRAAGATLRQIAETAGLSHGGVAHVLGRGT